MAQRKVRKAPAKVETLRWTMNVTLETASGRILRPVTVTGVTRREAVTLAARMAPKPGQSVLSVAVAK